MLASSLIDPGGASTSLLDLLALAPLPLFVYLLYRLWTLLYPMGPLARGEYAEARRGFERTTHFWIPSAARASRYNVALCLYLEGRLAEAEAALRGLAASKLDARLDYAVASLLGTVLVLGEDSAHAEEARLLLTRAQQEIPTPLGALVMAHAHLALGDGGGAARLVVEASTLPAAPLYRVGWKAALRFDPKAQESMQAFFRGWYFYRTGDMPRARAELEIAAQSPLPHVGVRRARALLPAASMPALDEGPPSSLSPHEFP